jgi:hypothetical protein
MEKQLSINKEKTMYLPQELINIISESPIALPNAYAVVLYNPKLTTSQIKRSLEILLQHLEHQIEIEKETA